MGGCDALERRLQICDIALDLGEVFPSELFGIEWPDAETGRRYAARLDTDSVRILRNERRRTGIRIGIDGVQTADGRTLKILNVLDEFTREALATDIARRIDADGVIACLDRLAAARGAPAYVRFDHGPEFIAHAVADWCRWKGTHTVFIDPGCPWQNARVESFNGRLRDEHLNGQQFDTLLEAQVLTEDWRIDYHTNRPHSAHGWLTPVEFLEAWLRRQTPHLA